MKKRKFSKISKLLDMPDEISSFVPKITMLGFKKIRIENYKNILEYQDTNVRLNTESGVINISGIDLKMEEMTTDDIIVDGRIKSLDFEELEKEE